MSALEAAPVAVDGQGAEDGATPVDVLSQLRAERGARMIRALPSRKASAKSLANRISNTAPDALTVSVSSLSNAHPSINPASPHGGVASSPYGLPPLSPSPPAMTGLAPQQLDLDDLARLAAMSSAPSVGARSLKTSMTVVTSRRYRPMAPESIMSSGEQEDSVAASSTVFSEFAASERSSAPPGVGRSASASAGPLGISGVASFSMNAAAERGRRQRAWSNSGKDEDDGLLWCVELKGCPGVRMPTGGS